MSQPVPPPQSGESTLSLQTSDPTQGTFWQSFTVFLWPFERFCARRWYLFFIGYFIIMFVTALATDLAFGSQYHDIWLYFRYENFPFSNSYLAFNSWHSVLIAAMFLLLGLAYRWQRSIPRFFHSLEQRGHLNDSEFGVEKTYQAYLSEYRRVLLYGKGRVLTRPVVIGVIVLCTFIILSGYIFINEIPYIMQLASVNVIAAAMQGLGLFVGDFFFPLYLTYLATTFIWVMGATGLYIRQFVDRFPLRIQPTHPDNCGGFKFVGDFALNVALIILAGVALFALFSLWRGASIWAFGTSILAILLLIISYPAFFVPISAVHRSMLKERSAYEDAIASRAVKVEEQINEVVRDGDLSRLKTAKEELDAVKALFPDKLRFPSWPFSWRTLITFFSS